MTPDEFLTHVRRDQQQYFLERLREYEAMLHMVGLLAGVAGTEEEQTAMRLAVKTAIEEYLGTLPESYWSIEEPMPVTTFGHGLIAAFLRQIGKDEAAEDIFRQGQVIQTVRTNFILRIGEMAEDLVIAIKDALVQWWNTFWDTYENEGLIIAMNRARIDLTFFAAECAIDIAISAALPGIGVAAASAIRGIRFVGMRTSRATTRVILKAIPNGTPDPRLTRIIDVEIADDVIDPDIDRIVDEDRFGGAGAIDDTDTRTTPNPDTPNTTVIRGAGRNEATIVVDPETGRPESVTASIMDDMGANPRADNATEIGRLGNDGDHGGHLIAHRFMGDVPDAGIVPQAGNLNTGAWKKMENEWADWIAYGRTNNKVIEVEVNIDIDPPGAVRPNRFEGDYRVYENHPDGTRTLLHEDIIDFENAAGQTFDRVYFRTDPDGTLMRQ